MRPSRKKGNRAVDEIVLAIANDIRTSRYRVAEMANRELLRLYYRTGMVLSRKIADNDWGDAVLSLISSGIQKSFPGIRGFSIRNLYNMRQFHDTYPSLEFVQSATAEIDKSKFVQSATAEFDRSKIGQSAGGKIRRPNRSIRSLEEEFLSKLRHDSAFQNAFLSLSFTHHVTLLQKCRNGSERYYYMHQASTNSWSVEVLRYHIESKEYKRRGRLANNFSTTLPDNLKAHALEAFKDEYLLNFVAVNDADGEATLESELVKNLKDFLMSLGREFAFMGNQYRLNVDDEEFFVDLLFYHRRLQSLVAIELKVGKFKPEYAGKMNFYLEALDSSVRLPHENPSIGIILCREKKSTIVEFAFKRVDRPMGVATYIFDTKLPPEIGRFIPSPAQLKRAAAKGIAD